MNEAVQDALADLVGTKSEDFDRTREILTQLWSHGYSYGWDDRGAQIKAKRRDGENYRRRAYRRHLHELQARYDQGVQDGWNARSDALTRIDEFNDELARSASACSGMP